MLEMAKGKDLSTSSSLPSLRVEKASLAAENEVAVLLELPDRLVVRKPPATQPVTLKLTFRCGWERRSEFYFFLCLLIHVLLHF